MPVNRERVGIWSEPREHAVTQDALARYVAATNDVERPVAPPLFAMVGVWPSVEEAVLGVLTSDLYEHVVHLVQDTRITRPIAAGDVLRSRARVAGISSNRAGTSIVGHVEIEDRGELYATIFVRGHSGEPPAGEPAPPTGGSRAGEPVAVVETKVDADQAVRYAEASGDHNPIHLDEAFAKSVGLPGVILHGMCTAALACRAAVRELCDGDSARIARFAGRFSRPVLPGQTLTTTFWPSADRAFVYQTTSPDGPAIKEGRVELR